LDLAQLGERQKLFRLADEITNLVISLNGSLSAAAGDGRLRAPYARRQYSDGILDLMLQVKKLFDPHGILNPGVKTIGMDEMRALMRGDYNLNHRHEHLPRS